MSFSPSTAPTYPPKAAPVVQHQPTSRQSMSPSALVDAQPTAGSSAAPPTDP